MSHFCSRFNSSRQDVFVPYIPKTRTSKQNTKKRKAKNDADEHKSSEKKYNRNGVEAKGTSILSDRTLKSPVLFLTADPDFLNNEVTQASTPALYQVEGRCVVKDRASGIVENQNLAGVGERNAVVDVFAIDGSSDCAFIERESGDRDDQQIIEHDSVSTGTFEPFTNETSSCVNGMPTPNSCSSKATSTPSEIREQSCSPAGISICAAETSNCRPSPDRQDSLLEVWPAPNTSELSYSSTADAYISGLRSDCEDEHSDSTRSTSFSVQGGVEKALKLKTVSQEPLGSKGKPTPLSQAADRDVSSELTETRDEDTLSGINVSACPGRELKALSKDEEHRYEVEKIVDHHERDGSISYYVKWLGWPKEKMTWEPASSFEDCLELIEEYWTSVKKRNSANNATNTEQCSSPSSDQMREDDGDRYEVEKIVNHDEHDGWLRYHVQWLGWPKEERTWEPASNLDDCSELIEEYWTSLKIRDSANNATKTRDRSSPSCDLRRDEEASVSFGVVGSGVLSSQSLLEAQQVQSEVLDGAASENTTHKRKLQQSAQKYPNEDGEDSDGSVDTKVLTKKRKGVAKRCRHCKEKGHNTRTCQNDAIGTSD